MIGILRRPGRAHVLAAAVAVLAEAPLATAAPPAVVDVQLPPGASAAALPEGATPLVDAADAEVLAGRAALRGRSIPDLGRWYQVPADSPAEGRALARALDAPAGQRAMLQTPPPPPPRASCRQGLGEGGWPQIPARGPAPDLSAAEDHRAGLDMPPAADGAGVRVGDIEYGWRERHEELRDRALPATPQEALSGFDSTMTRLVLDHGTSVLSVIGATADGRGSSGLAPKAALTPVSPIANGSYNVAGAVVGLAADLRPGDVLLIEQQAYVDAARTRLGPVEVNAAVRQAIRAATDAGVVVIEPAGNGVVGGDEGVDLDPLGIPLEGQPGYSGAIMVGAGQSSRAMGGGTDLAREDFSNHGRRVDVQGYGESVVTAGGSFSPGDIGGPTPELTYTACFNGTSSAAATVAGAVAALQSHARVRLGAPLEPGLLRRRLVATGLPQADPERGRIGPRPQAQGALPSAVDLSPPVPAHAPTPAAAPVAAPPPSAPGATAAAARRASRLPAAPAARGAAARYAPRARLLTIRLRALAPRATVRVGGRRVAVSAGRVIVRVSRPAAVTVRVTAPGRRGAAYRVGVTRAGAVRVAGVTPPRPAARR